MIRAEMKRSFMLTTRIRVRLSPATEREKVREMDRETVPETVREMAAPTDLSVDARSPGASSATVPRRSSRWTVCDPNAQSR